uniref:Uncharacterized protein n=1 Tax=Strombidium sp. TaxID=181122 RepID=A0A7T0M4L7_9SPIT|nr:hypothetical protein [Strombidium sp.]
MKQISTKKSKILYSEFLKKYFIAQTVINTNFTLYALDYSKNFKKKLKKKITLMVLKRLQNKYKRVKFFFKFFFKFPVQNKLFLINFIKSLNIYYYSRFILVEFLRYKQTANLLFKHTRKILQLNFLRYRFFPKIYDYLTNYQYINLSLGMMSWRYKNKKSFKKNKLVYLLLANFLRKILLYSGIKSYILVIKKIPVYYKEIINSLLNPVIAPYEHPFEIGNILEEKNIKNPFWFSYILFYNNKPYGKLKLKKKGRLKRKISKKITMINRIVD